MDAIAVGPTVSAEIEDTQNPGFRHQFTSVRDNLLVELAKLPFAVEGS
jgi:hypothetical protein